MASTKYRGRQTPFILATLKRLYRARGLRYRDVAAKLHIGEATLRRWLAGKGLTTEHLEDLCAILDIGLAELIDIATRGQDGRLMRLTLAQEEALAGDVRLASVFTLILSGWSPRKMRLDTGMTEAGLVKILVRLEKLRLIDLLPGNEVRLLTVRDIEWRRGGPMRRAFESMGKRNLVAMNFGAPDAIWEGHMLKLSPSSAAQLPDMFRAFIRELQHLGVADSEDPSNNRSWYNVLLLAPRIDFTLLDDEPVVESRRINQGSRFPMAVRAGART